MFKDYMVQACFWSTLFYSASYPTTHIFLMRQVNERLISVNQIFMCISIIVINSLWNKYSDKLYKTFPKFMFTESLLYLILHLCVIAGLANAVTYYIVDTILFCLITKNMICGGNKLRSLVYKDEEREKYDNIVPVASAISTLIGACIAFLIVIPIKAAFALSWLGITVDNIFYYIAYKKNMAAE